MRRIALNLQYNGYGFAGWQRQPNAYTVQGALEEAIASLEPTSSISVVAAGRTDAGVHAAGQVVHFDALGPIPARRWASALNGRLPESIRVNESVEVPHGWHACFSALYRRYRYTIFNGSKPNLFISQWSWHRYQYRLDEDSMVEVSQGLIGNHDFSAFQRAGSTRPNAITNIQSLKIERQGDLLLLEIQASGFLYGMVRLLVGQLVAVGEHRLSSQAFESRWKERRRLEVKEAAPAKGLCFLGAGYKKDVFSKSVAEHSFPRFTFESEASPRYPS